MRATLSCLTICLLTFFATALLGQTPDDQTPAAETPCDLESGAAFGLCISYCEAMDCDGADPAASEEACLIVKDQYVQITGNPSLPCEAVCNDDFFCDPGEDCVSCPNDCPNGQVCGNGICEAGDGEDCVSCPADCNGVQGGKPQNRYCCGDGDGENPIPCNYPACGVTCTDVPVSGAPYCCGNGTCEPAEDTFSCEIDCS